MCCHEKSVHEKSVSQNIQNIFFVLKISKDIFLAGQGEERGEEQEELSLPG
jgi:hypothetical protein